MFPALSHELCMRRDLTLTCSATKRVDQSQVSTNDVCGVNPKDANAAAIAYPFISGFRVSTVEQKGGNNS